MSESGNPPSEGMPPQVLPFPSAAGSTPPSEFGGNEAALDHRRREPRDCVTVKAPAKMNLALAVGPIGTDGYHPLATVFHALDIFDTVTVSQCSPAERGVTTKLNGVTGEVPSDQSNLSWLAAEALAAHLGRSADVHISIDKRIPVAAGLAGGSADAAGTLVACNELWAAGMEPSELAAVAATLGSDVAFALFGGTMLGLGRGEQLSPVLAKANLRWVVAVSDSGLSTASVYTRFDQLQAEQLIPAESAEPAVPRDLMTALAAGDFEAIGASLVNDLSAAAYALRPSLRRTLDVGVSMGALGAVVSGSGPTCCFLAANDESAIEISVALMSEGACDRVIQAHGPVPGALSNIQIGRA